MMLRICSGERSGRVGSSGSIATGWRSCGTRLACRTRLGRPSSVAVASSGPAAASAGRGCAGRADVGAANIGAAEVGAAGEGTGGWTPGNSGADDVGDTAATPRFGRDRVLSRVLVLS